MKCKRLIWMLCLPMLITSCGGNSDTTSTKTSTNSSKASTVESTKTSTVVSTKESDSTPAFDTFIMEAELTDLTGKKGAGYSGGCSGKEMVQQDVDNAANSNNGYWLGYLYVTNMSVDFVFTSTKAVNDVELTLRLTSEIKDVVLTSDNYTIEMNGETITDYGTINLAGASSSDSTGYVRPFSNHKLKKKINVKEGTNSLKLITSNSDAMGGTMYATAPMVDCVRLTGFGDAKLSYNPIEDNLSLFEE